MRTPRIPAVTGWEIMDWDKQPLASNTANMAASHPSVGMDTAPGGGRNPKEPQAGANSSRLRGGGQQQGHVYQQDVSEVVGQLVPALPQILAQAQSPYAASGYAAYGQAPRLLSQQDVNEVVRQLLPIVPQIVGMLQGQPQLQYAAMQGGGGLGQFGH